MPETFVLYAFVVTKPDVAEREMEARRIEWYEDVDGLIDTEAFSN